MRRLLLSLALLVPAAARAQDYAPADKELRAVRIDSDPRASFLAVRADTRGRLFVGGREALFVYEPDDRGGYKERRLLYRFPDHTWVYDIELRGNDLYVLTVSALYRFPGGAESAKVQPPQKLLWGVPMGHVHQCFHALAWGPEGDLYLSMGDPLWYYGDFERPDHWGHWTFFSQPAGTKVPYTGVGAVFRVKPDGSDFRVVARGLRNPCGLCFDRHWNLFTNDNDHEALPALYVPGRLLHVVPGADFAWPRGWLPSKTPDRADLLEPVYGGMGRAVPVLQAYYADALLPAKYRDNLLVARWGVRTVTRYPLRPNGTSFRATEEPLLVGKDDARPVGVSVGRGGRIFATIAHMAHNENSPVYRSDLVMLTTAADPATHPFEPYDATTAKPAKLWSELADPSWQRRYRAHVELLRRGGELLKDANKRLLNTRPDEPAFHHLVWLAAASRQHSLHLIGLLGHDEPLVRFQVVRALAEFPENLDGQPAFTRLLLDPDPRVQLAAVLAYRSPQVEWLDAIRHQIAAGPARSKDSYLRQAATLLLAEKGTVKQLQELCKDDSPAGRLAGVLAVGARLTVPPATAPLADDLPLAKLPAESAYTVTLADGKHDLRKLGRVGNFTTAEHWKAGKHTDEQESLFALLRTMLKDKDEPVRLQAAHFLELLHDPRSEPDIARVRTASAERRLAVAPIRSVDQLWVTGPFPDGKAGFKTVHPPEQGAVDLAASYDAGGKKLAWQLMKRDYQYALSKTFGPCDHASFYAFTRLDSPARQKAHLLVGSDDGVKVWHNGKLVWTKDVIRPALPFQDVVSLDLQPGGNEILVRVRNETDTAALYVHYRGPGVIDRLPEKLAVSLAERLKDAGKDAPVGKEFVAVDWPAAVKKGDAKNGRQLFAALACAKCHGVSADAPVAGGPSLADAAKRFTVAYLVESILLPSKQVSPVFRATQIETKAGQVVIGLVVGETAERIELLLPDATRKLLPVADLSSRRLIEQSPMPAGLVRRPDELRDLLAYLLSERPEAP